MIKTWVIGSGGLLGSALCRELRSTGTELFSLTERFFWENEYKLISQFSAGVQAFAAQVSAADQWEIYWSAGVGTMSSSASELALETKALSVLLRLIKSHPQLTTRHGVLALASSAGAIYAGSADEIISENTLPAANTNYANEKLKQEDMIRSFVLANSSMAALIARISTLYGSGHSVQKKQGLLSHIARCILKNQPIHIYVPLDTIRDYIYADDAAASMISTLRLKKNQPDTIVTKIIASEQPASIAEIISIFKRIARRSPRIITSTSCLSDIYPRRVRFHSIVVPKYTHISRSLLVGISQILAAERTVYVRNI